MKFVFLLVGKKLESIEDTTQGTEIRRLGRAVYPRLFVRLKRIVSGSWVLGDEKRIEA